MNALTPGVYESITKIDFQRLDELGIKPLGIYGCKGEIVRLLQSLGAVDEELCVIDYVCHVPTYHFSQCPLATCAK